MRKKGGRYHEKKLWIILALAMLTLALTCASALAEYKSGSCGSSVSWTLDTSTGILTISGTGAMTEYEYIGEVPWYEDMRENIQSVVIQNGVTSLSQYVFCLCANQTSITIPDSVTSIDYSAFYGCSALTSASILNPDCVIGNSAYDVFRNCAPGFTLHGWSGSTAQIYAQNAGIAFTPLIPDPAFLLPAGMTAIEADAFQGIAAQAVVIPKNVTTISGNPFADSSVRYIFGFPGSAAQTLAGSYGFTFVPIDDAWLAVH